MRHFINYSIAFMSLIFIISACSNDSEPMLSNQTRSVENDIQLYSSDALPKPILSFRNDYIDTLTTWGFYIKTPGGIGGSYKQLQHSKSGDNWQDVEVGYYPDIYVKKQGYSYGDHYFRARTLASLEFAKVDKPTIYEASPWSETIRGVCRLLEDGTPHTEKEVVVQIVFHFNSRNNTQYIEKGMLDKFQADLLADGMVYHINSPFNSKQVNGCSFIYNYSTQKGSVGGLVVTIDVLNKCQGSYMSFNSISESFHVQEDATIFTPLHIYNIYVTVYN